MKTVLGLFIILTIIAINNAAAICHLPNPLPAGMVVIDNGCNVSADNIPISDLLILVNHGTIGGTFRIDGPYELAIRNDGDFNASISLSGGAKVFQYISSMSELTPLSIDVYTPIIMGDFTGRLNAAKLIELFDGGVEIRKNKLAVDASRAELSKLAEMFKLDAHVSEIYFYITDGGGDFSPPDFGINAFYSFGASPDPMFVYWTDGNGRQVAARQTEYAVIFGGDPRAKFLDDLRIRDPGNKVLLNLDGAQNLSDLLSEMNRTMFFNPLVLNESILEKMTRIEFVGDMNPGFYGGAKTDLFGAYQNAGFDLGFVGRDFVLKIDFHTGRLIENDKYKYGAATVYGAGATANTKYFGFGAKAAFADWDGVLIQDGVAAVTSAESRLFYVFSEFAPRIAWVQPVFRLNYAGSEILGRKSGDFFASGGGRVGFSEKVSSGENTYGAFATYGRGVLDYGLIIGFRFIEDGAALGVRISRANLSIETQLSF